MSIKELINNDVKEAMRARDKKKLDTLRLITAAIKQIEVDERILVNDERMLPLLDKLAKQRKESTLQFQAAGRQDLVAQEQHELAIINHYLPQALSEYEINAFISEAIKQTGATKRNDMSKVMAILRSKLQGRADMSQVSQSIKTLLS